MLRTIGRNGFVQCRQPFANRYHRQIYPLSTKASTSDSTQSNSILPEPTPTPRKSKVDLKPAPLKSNPPPAHKSILVSSTLPLKSAPLPLVTTPPNDDGLVVSAAVKEARKDIFKAQEQGVLVPPPANAGWIAKLYHQVKQLFKFYWNGLKQINRNRIQVAQMKARVQAGGEPISRAEFRFITTYKEDAFKLVPFVLIVLILEELIPLIAIYAPGMLPSTTIFPSQLARIEEKALAKQVWWASHRGVFSRIHSFADSSGSTSIPLPRLRSLDAHKALAGVLRVPTWGPGPLVLFRLGRHLKFVAKDDELLAKEDFGCHLKDEEVKKALGERGIIANKLDQGLARRQLKGWLQEVSFGAEEDNAVPRRIFAVAKANSR